MASICSSSRNISRPSTSKRNALAAWFATAWTAVAAYYDAHRKLIAAGLLQTAASIMANEGQHLVVLRQAAGQAPVPNALETGDER